MEDGGWRMEEDIYTYVWDFVKVASSLQAAVPNWLCHFGLCIYACKSIII